MAMHSASTLNTHAFIYNYAGTPALLPFLVARAPLPRFLAPPQLLPKAGAAPAELFDAASAPDAWRPLILPTAGFAGLGK